MEVKKAGRHLCLDYEVLGALVLGKVVTHRGVWFLSSQAEAMDGPYNCLAILGIPETLSFWSLS